MSSVADSARKIRVLLQDIIEDTDSQSVSWSAKIALGHINMIIGQIELDRQKEHHAA